MLPAADTTGYPTPQVHLPLTNGTLNTTPAGRGMGQTRADSSDSVGTAPESTKKLRSQPCVMLKSTPLSSFHPLR